MTQESLPVAVVTGAAGGIGTALMRELVQAGYTVVGLDLASASPKLSGDQGPKSVMMSCDITNESEVTTAFASIIDTYGRLDLLVNNAGISALGTLHDHDIDTWRRVMDVNYIGAILCTRAAFPNLSRSRGHIVVMSSVAGFAPVIGRPAYVGAKHAVTGTFEALRPELATQGVGLTLVHPTFVVGGMTESHRPEAVERATTGPEITPDDVARAVVNGLAKRHHRVLVGRTSNVAWRVSRWAPTVYQRLMVRALQRNKRTVTANGGTR